MESEQGEGEATVQQRAEDHFIRAVQDRVRPEFFNRIDRIVPFLPLDEDSLRAIARRELEQVGQREGIRFGRIDFHFSDAVVDAIVRLGYEPQYGARPLKRAIQRHLLVPLAEALNQHSGGSHRRAQVDVHKDRIRIALHGESKSPDESSMDLASASEVVKLVTHCCEIRRKVMQVDQSGAVLELRNDIALRQRQRQRERKRKRKRSHQRRGRTAAYA